MGIENRRHAAAARAHPEFAELASETMTYGVMLNDPEIVAPLRKLRHVPAEMTDAFTAQVATLIAARYRDLIAAPDFAGKTRDLLDDEERALAQRALREHPQVSPEQLAQAQTMAGHFLATRNDFSTPAPTIVIATMAACLGLMAFVNFASVLVFGTSPGLRLFGLVVVNRAGEPAGRLRLLGRSLVAWLPFLLAILSAGLAASNAEWSTSTAIACAGLLLCSLVGILYTLRVPPHGPHDVIAGTRLVPR